MGLHTDIQWCDSTINPTTGCDGCELWSGVRRSCYAGPVHEGRLAHTFPDLYAKDFSEVRLAPGRMAKAASFTDLTGKFRYDKPWLDRMPRTIFVGDMGDIFSHDVPFDYLKSEVIDVARTPKGRRHIWMLLTKRPGRLCEFQAWLGGRHDSAWPENIWSGTSITCEESLARARTLGRYLQGAWFLSIEPLLGPLSLRGMFGCHEFPGLIPSWVIVGGESGPDARPFDLDWARRLRDECAAAGVPFFLKQLGSSPVVKGRPLTLHNRHGGDWSEWPDDLRIRQMPKA